MLVVFNHTEGFGLSTFFGTPPVFNFVIWYFLIIFAIQDNLIESIKNVKMDKNTLEFITYCISKLSQRLKLSQQDVYRRLKVSGILRDYLIPSYDVLHTFGSNYLMDDIISFMQEKGVLAK